MPTPAPVAELLIVDYPSLILTLNGQQGFAHRSDMNRAMDSKPDWPVMVQLAGIRICQDLRFPVQNFRIDVPAGVSEVEISADALGYGGASNVRSVWIATAFGNQARLRQVIPEELRYHATARIPCEFAFMFSGGKDKIVFASPADHDYSLTVTVEGEKPLSAQNPVNYVITRYPDIYLWASMTIFGQWSRDQRAVEWNQAYLQSVAMARGQESRRNEAVQRMVDQTMPGLHRSGNDIRRG